MAKKQADSKMNRPWWLKVDQLNLDSNAGATGACAQVIHYLSTIQLSMLLMSSPRKVMIRGSL